MSNEAKNGLQRWLTIIPLVLSCLAGAFSVGAIVLKGGWILHKVETHDTTLIEHNQRLAKIESDGSPKISAHEKLDDERDTRARERFAALESAVKTVTQLAVEVGKVSQKLDDMRDMMLPRKP